MTKLDHVGIAVGDNSRLANVLTSLLGPMVQWSEVISTEGVAVDFLRLGEGKLELLSGAGAESPIGRFIEKRGKGLHHLAIGVDDIAAVHARCVENGLKLAGGGPRPGADGKTIFFLHPSECDGVLLEFCQSREQVPGGAIGSPELNGETTFLFTSTSTDRSFGLQIFESYRRRGRVVWVDRNDALADDQVDPPTPPYHLVVVQPDSRLEAMLEEDAVAICTVILDLEHADGVSAVSLLTRAPRSTPISLLVCGDPTEAAALVERFRGVWNGPLELIVVPRSRFAQPHLWVPLTPSHVHTTTA